MQIQPITVISLGQSCTVAGAVRDYGIREFAFPFDWIVSPFNSLYQVFEDDFKFFRNVIERFYGQSFFTLKDIIDYLNEHPEVVKINQYLQKDFLENQKNKTQLVLKQ